MKSLSSIALTLLLAVQLTAQNAASKGATATPASMTQMILPSHDSVLLGVLYLAAGTDLHPTAIILHGFPGFEQNLDLAQTLRARGWNVLAMHYRGSWGVKGDFSFQHAAEDADTEVRYLLDAANAQKYHVDTHRVIVIGHSMGGYMAASAAAHNPEIAGAVLISAGTLAPTTNQAPGEILQPSRRKQVRWKKTTIFYRSRARAEKLWHAKSTITNSL